MRGAGPVLKVKPRLRGVSHEYAFYGGLVAAAALIVAAAPGLPTVAATVYGFSVVALFGTSALYHRPMWSPRARLLMKRFDHAAIFVLIAGTYTPITLLGLGPDRGAQMLAWVWGGAALGIVRALFWPGAPRWLTAALYVALGWAMVVEWRAFADALGPARLGLILGGGVVYTLGAVVYARRRPDPVPTVFGYHEVFHALVVLASVCHFAAVGSLIVV